VQAPFTINFRREVFRREREHSRRRLFQLGGWVTYFGLMTLLIGLYGLNCQWVTDRARTVAGQVDRMRKSEAAGAWQASGSQVQEIERQRERAGMWRARLERLSILMPPQAILTSIAVNPDNLPGVAEQNLFAITGSLKVRPGGASSMSEVVGFVSRLKSDSLFARGFSSFRLASSEMVEGTPPTVRFVVECR
jgi:hypothetical protein